jgi:hypothetical protein
LNFKNHSQNFPNNLINQIIGIVVLLIGIYFGYISVIRLSLIREESDFTSNQRKEWLYP